MDFDPKELGREWGGQKGALVGKEREQAIIAWLARWRYSTAEILALVLSKDRKTTTKAATDKLAKMIRHKLIRKVDCIFVNRGYVYLLTPLGVEYYRRLSQRKIPPRLDASKIRSNTQVPHDLGVQMYVAHKYRSGEVKEFMTNSELRWKYREECCTDPDALIVDHDSKRTAVEFEPTQKSEKRMRGKYLDGRHDPATRDKLELGVFDRHHYALKQWCDDQTTYWGYVDYVMFGKKASDSYRNWLNAYYNLRVGKERAKGWSDSYSFNIQAGKSIERYIYFSVVPTDNISSLL